MESPDVYSYQIQHIQSGMNIEMVEKSKTGSSWFSPERPLWINTSIQKYARNILKLYVELCYFLFFSRDISLVRSRKVTLCIRFTSSMNMQTIWYIRCSSTVQSKQSNHAFSVFTEL